MKPSDTYVNPLLTDVYIGYGGAQNYVAGQLFPTVFEDKESGVYFVRDKENLRAPADARRGLYDRANEVKNTLSRRTFNLEEKTLEHPVPWRIVKNQSAPFDAKKNGVMLVTDKLKLDKEVDLQATILASGAPSLDTAASWATASTDINGQIRTGRNSIQRQTGRRANTVMLSKNSYDALMKNQAFLDAVKYTSFPSEGALRGKIAEWFDVERVIIGDAINNTAKEGQATDVLNWVWGSNVIIAYVNPTPIIEDTTAGLEIKLSQGAYVDEWQETWRKCDIVRANDFYDNYVVDPTAMYILTNTN